MMTTAVLDPLAELLVRRIQRATTWREQSECEQALEELGYWLQVRPVGTSREDMEEVCKNGGIVTTCDPVIDFNFTELLPEVEGGRGHWTATLYKEKEKGTE